MFALIIYYDTLISELTNTDNHSGVWFMRSFDVPPNWSENAMGYRHGHNT